MKLIKINIFIFILLLVVILLNHFYMYKKSGVEDYVYNNDYQISREDYLSYELGTDDLIQTIYATNNGLKKIKIYLDPIDKKYNSTDYLEVNLLLELKDEEGNTIEKYKYEKVFMDGDDKSIVFEFPKIENSEDRKYYLYISSYKKDNNVSIKLGKNEENDKYDLYINQDPSEYSLFYKTVYEYKVDLHFKGITITLVIVFSLLLLIINLFKNKLSLEKKYFIIAFVVCLCMNFLTPIFNGNDETSHWTRIYEIANGNLVTNLIDEWPRSYVPAEALDISFASYREVPSKLTREYAKNEVLVNMEYMAVYSPISYIPQVLGFLVSKLFTSNLFINAYAARIFETLFCLVCFYFSIKIIPLGKKVLFLIGLLPTVVSASSLLTADAMLFSTIILFVSKIIQIIYEKRTIKKGDYILLGILSIIIAISKLVYFPLCFLLFLIPMRSNNNRKKKIIYVLFILLLSFIITGLWNVIALQNLTSGQGVNVAYYIQYYKKFPLEFLQITYYTFLISIGNFISDIFGGINAWYGTFISDASIYPLVFFVLFLLLATQEEWKMPKKEKLMIGGILLITYLLISTSLLFTCTPVHYAEIIGIQGRYFIPFLFPCALLFSSKNFKNKLNIDLENIIIIVYLAYFLRYMLFYL